METTAGFFQRKDFMNSEIKDIVNGSWDITHSLMPRQNVIYHYTSPSGLLGILEAGGSAKLYFTQYDSLNDKSERNHAIDTIYHVCENCVKKKIFSQKFYEIVKECTDPQKILFLRPSTKHPRAQAPFWDEYDTYLCSFSEGEDSLPMWNYYSKSQHYEGYNIGFYIGNMSAERFSGYRLDIAKIIYQDEKKETLIENLLIPIAKKLECANKTADNPWLIPELTNVLNNVILAFKKSCFAHEEEVRMILRIPKCYRDTGTEKVSERKYRHNNGYIIPYVEYSFEKKAVCEIHIAPLLEPEITQQNIYDLLAQRNYTCVHVFPSEIPIRF